MATLNDKKEAANIITLEGLQGYNLFEERPDKEDEIVIKKENENWIVYVTSERAAKRLRERK